MASANAGGRWLMKNPHILDYFYASSIGGSQTPLVNALVRRGRARLSDVDESYLVKSDGTVGARAERQRIQRMYTLLAKVLARA